MIPKLHMCVLYRRHALGGVAGEGLMKRATPVPSA